MRLPNKPTMFSVFSSEVTSADIVCLQWAVQASRRLRAVSPLSSPVVRKSAITSQLSASPEATPRTSAVNDVTRFSLHLFVICFRCTNVAGARLIVV